MVFSQNIHPNKKWVKVEARVWGLYSGQCFRLMLTDDSGKHCDLNIHYGEEKNANEFVTMLKEDISKLPIRLNTCGQEIK